MGARVIRDAARALAAAIGPAVAGALGEGVVVAVYDAEPSSTTGPAVWLRFTFATRLDVGWSITHEAVIVADAGLANPDAAEQLGTLTDAVLTVTVPGVAPADVTAAPGDTVRIGEVTHPAVVVTLPLLHPHC
jgi:hypothetical protein